MSMIREMRTFLVVWSGQLLSMLGTAMTQFAMIIWVWNQTQTATALVLITVISGIASLCTQPIAGPLVDRWNRKHIMIGSDLVAGLCTLSIFLLYLTANLQVWHLYLLATITGVSGAFQSLAYSAGLTTMLSKAYYTRARGMVAFAGYASVVAAPILAGTLLSRTGLLGILVIDIITFLCAVTTLLAIYIPAPAKADRAPDPLWRDSLTGFQFILARPGLFGLLCVAFAFSIAEALGFLLLNPMILARTGGDEAILGSVRAAQGIGGVVGGVVASAWGGPQRRIHGVLLGFILTGLLGDAMMGLGQTTLWWLVAAFSLEVFLPVALSAYHTIWQVKVPAALQGRVFAAVAVASSLGEPLAGLVGGLVTDRLLEPAMRPGGALVSTFGWLVGVGPGAGMGLLLVVSGLLTAIVSATGYCFRSVRRVELDLPEEG